MRVKCFFKNYFLFILLGFNLNACLLNPIVQQILCFKTGKDSRESFFLTALLLNQNPYIELNRTWAGIRKGESLQLEGQYFAFGQNLGSSFQWSSSDPSVASVDSNGLVSGIGNGKVTIRATASDGRASADSNITVYSGYVFTTFNLDNLVGHLTQNASTGILSPTGTIGAGAGSDPNGIVTDPAGKFLFTGNFANDTISQFTINQTTGALIPNATFTSPAGTNPRNLVVTPDGKYVYLASEGTQSIRAFAINADGTLSFINSYPTGNAQTQLQISRDGNFIFFLSSSFTELVSYRINPSSGTLAQAATSPSFSNDYSGNVSTHPNGNYLYVGTFPSITVLGFDFVSGNMSLVESVTHSLRINGSAIHPNGRFYYTVNIDDGSISCYMIDPNTGKLSFNFTLSVLFPSSLRFMVIDPTGRYAYVADNNDVYMFQFSINQTTGELTSLGTVNLTYRQWNLTFL
ncbi:6-phosphogluconolactonase [Leptospira yanagawae]|uniref:6-phosphogluconolactonase n=2 Tax=Leptospira yanagawae TaxID=293069 RepID=A0ABY2M5Z7_9LEPT|nr:6-phosphogluconolactonase [Leptospira yanagawae]